MAERPDEDRARQAARLDHLLAETSRTFALTIPFLPEPTRREATVAYLLFRIADTLEDATLWSGARKAAELDAFGELLESPSEEAAAARAAAWMVHPPLRHAGYLALLADVPLVLGAARTLAPEARRLVLSYTLRTAREMKRFVLREREGALRLTDVADLKGYCYAVAGIVGELLTELFVLGRDRLQPIAGPLRADAAAFGEALQLVNILKDASDDSTEGRHFLPAGVSRDEVLRIARDDLAIAARYCARLEDSGAERGLVAFNVLPLLLARATLDRVEAHGPGAKVTRPEVAELVRALDSALDDGAATKLLWK